MVAKIKAHEAVVKAREAAEELAWCNEQNSLLKPKVYQTEEERRADSGYREEFCIIQQGATVIEHRYGCLLDPWTGKEWHRDTRTRQWDASNLKHRARMPKRVLNQLKPF